MAGVRPLAFVPRLLSIAGSDSGGGAGIQADLKAFAACGAHGMTAITAITAQSTTGITAVHPVPPEVILAQVRAVAGDIDIDAVKIGMLGTVATIEAVAQALDELPPTTPVVLDPVMVAESGAELLDPHARTALVELLVPRATVLTPNLPEARALLGRAPAPAATGADAHALARGVHALNPGPVGLDGPGLDRAGPHAVVITGGHRDQAVDVFYDGAQLVEITGPRYPSRAAHGSGCTHSSVLAAEMARGAQALDAARRAKVRAAEAVRDGLEQIGHGPGPVDVLGLTVRELGRSAELA